ncbi:MAG: hypothetical protein Q8L29_00415 [archaeon]|nr:hypothetical protein [archaeon]
MAQTENKHEKKEEAKIVQANDNQTAHQHAHDNKSVSSTEKHKESPKEPKKAQPLRVKKEEAIARGLSLPISKKSSMYICNFIRNKTIDGAMAELQEVIKFKRAIPFRGEIPHRKGKGMMSGRYPIKASKHFINLLKALKGNVIANGMDLDKSRIVICSANFASRPQMKGGARFKRAHITLIAKEIKESKEHKEEKK